MYPLFKDQTFVIIPAKDEENHIGNVIRKTLRRGYNNIIVVNDGSKDQTAQIARGFPTVTVLNHIINLGPGASTFTGIKYAITEGAKYIVTLDADNQHDPADIDNLVNTMATGSYDLVIGSRFLKKNRIPKSRVFYNKIGNIISYFVTGMYLSDSQSGVKVLSRKFGKKIDIRHNGFEFCIEMIQQAKIHKAVVKEIPVNVRYSRETMQKGQNLITGINMVIRLLKPF